MTNACLKLSLYTKRGNIKTSNIFYIRYEQLGFLKTIHIQWLTFVLTKKLYQHFCN